jgi:murein DD-endopeptidase MepM/ murein hydrolase activator NlpD
MTWLPRAVCLAGFSALAVAAEPFRLPTANHAIYEPGKEDHFVVGTVGKPWTSGTYGCVRSYGQQLHEGLDIKCLQRDRQGEPIDPVMATADGTVAYFNAHPSLSTYGNYVVLRHRIEGLEIYSLYAHLREIRRDLQVGQAVKAGEVVATLGRTAGTHEGISKERAHVHFELNLLANDRFASWFQQTSPGQRNDHGGWNGQNLLGLDPWLILMAQHTEGQAFSLLSFVRRQPELCRVLVRRTQFPWIKRYYPLIRRNPLAESEGIAGYELALNYNGMPFELIPRAASELKGAAKYQLLSVNATEQREHPCRHLVAQRGAHWTLTAHGVRLLDMLTY